MTSLIVILLFIAGIAVGLLFRNKNRAKKTIDILVTVAIYALLFLLGISVGINDKVLEDFSRIGLKAVLLTIGAVFGSIILAKPVYHYFFKRPPLTPRRGREN